MTRMLVAANAVILCVWVTHSNAQVSEMCKPTLVPRASGSQVADKDFLPPIANPAYRVGAGPKVILDEAHLNFHTVEGRYSPFVSLLRRDGFVVEPNRRQFNADALAPANILVIANALAPRNKESGWTLPAQSAFSKPEIDAVREWVSSGGALLLIADHMPFPGVAADLAREFGVFMIDGFATDRTCADDEFVFRLDNKTLADHPVTRGRNEAERVDSVRSFTGQAFRIPATATSLLVLEPETVILLPQRAWRFTEDTPRIR